jgi:actin, alpha cardiac muscle
MAAFDDDVDPAVILDPGTHMIQSGFADEDDPRAVFPPIVGRPLNRGHRPPVSLVLKDAFVGDEVTRAKRGILISKRPLDPGGIVANWDDMEKILHHTFYNELRVAPEEQPFLLAEPVMAPLQQRERFCELSFEKFGVNRYATVMNCMLDAYASGNVEGLVVSVGATEGFVCGLSMLAGDASQEFPGCQLVAPPMRLPVQGKQVTEYLLELLRDRRGYLFDTAAEYEQVQTLKEQLCFVQLDDEEEGSEATYELPDGRPIHVNEERYLATEAMFDPSVLDVSGPGVSDAVAAYLESHCVVELRDRLAANIILAGGSTMFRGFKTRLQSDLEGRFQTPIGVAATGTQVGSVKCWSAFCSNSRNNNSSRRGWEVRFWRPFRRSNSIG